MLFTLQGAEMSGTKWRRAQGFSEDFWQPLASASALCACPWHVIPLLLWTSKGDAFPHRNWVHSLYPRVLEPVHYLVKTVQIYESPKSCRIYALCSFHCSVGINGYKLGDGERESFCSPNMWILNFSFDLQPYSLSLLCSVPYQQSTLSYCYV